MNTQKGFAPILIILLGVVVIGGGTYFYFNEKVSKESVELSVVDENDKNQQKNDVNKIEVDEKEGKDKNLVSINMEGITGFSFKDNDPSIVHPFTKRLVESKNNIKESEVTDNNGSIFFKNTEEIIVEFKRYHCCGGGQRYSLYVYANKNSNLITAITFEDDYKLNDPITPNFIQGLIPNFKNKIKLSMPILQSPPTDIVIDGYYYVSTTDWDSINRELEVDFLTISSKEEPFNGYTIAFDILMSATTYYYSTWTNIQFENNLVNQRKFKVSEDLVNKIKWEGVINKNLDNIQLWKDVPCFIKIKDGKITEVRMVVAAG